jgi:hypothetical protein
MHHVQDIPGSIVVAICKVQATLDAVAKTQRNGHGGYQFASTDDIYAALTRRLGEVGLAILPLELERGQDRPVAQGLIRFRARDRAAHVDASDSEALTVHPGDRSAIASGCTVLCRESFPAVVVQTSYWRRRFGQHASS